MSFIIVTFVWLFVLAVIAGVFLWMLHEVAGESSAYRNTVSNRIIHAVRGFFLF